MCKHALAVASLLGGGALIGAVSSTNQHVTAPFIEHQLTSVFVLQTLIVCLVFMLCLLAAIAESHDIVPAHAAASSAYSSANLVGLVTECRAIAFAVLAGIACSCALVFQKVVPCDSLLPCGLLALANFLRCCSEQCVAQLLLARQDLVLPMTYVWMVLLSLAWLLMHIFGTFWLRNARSWSSWTTRSYLLSWLMVNALLLSA